MRLTRQAALAVALICGLLAAVLAWMWIGQQSKPVVRAAETVEVPVPVRTIPAQVDLQPEMFRKVTLDKTKVAAGTVVDEQNLVGRVSMVELLSGQMILESQVALRSKALGLAYGIPRGQRAESIALDLVGAVTDFVQPGDRVDVLSTASVGSGKYITHTILQDVLVLAAGTSLNPTPPPAPPAAPTTPGATPVKAEPPKRIEMPYTLCVTPAQAQLLYLADQVSHPLRLTLRGMGDNEIVPLPAGNSWTFIGPIPKDAPGSGGGGAPAPAPAPAQPAPAAAPQPAPQAQPAAQPVAPACRKPTVEIIRGGQRELVTPE